MVPLKYIHSCEKIMSSCNLKCFKNWGQQPNILNFLLYEDFLIDVFDNSLFIQINSFLRNKFYYIYKFYVF